MNTQKGFSTILLILLGFVIIGGGAYYLISKDSSEKILKENIFDTEKSDESEDLNIEATSSDTINTYNSESTSLQGVYGFSFRIDEPSIVHPFTKELASKKSKISNDVIEDDGGSVFFRDDDEIIVEFERYHCCGGGQRNSLYVYANDNSNLITAITFEDDYKFGSPIDISFIKKLIPQFKSEIKPTMPILQNPPSDKVSDGYYYVKLVDWNSNKREVEIDFLSISEGDRGQEGYNTAFDILMSATTYYYSYWTNIELENNLENTRVFNVSDSLNNKIQWGGEINKNTERVDLLKDVNYFIKISEGEISEMYMVVAAG